MVRRKTGLDVPLLFGALASLSLFWAGSPAARAQNPPATPQQRPSVIDPKAQALLDKTIQALGGPAFLSFKSLTTTGRSFAIADEQTAGFSLYESVVEYPDKRRVTYGKKPPVILINNGDKGWEIDRYGTISQKRAEVRLWQLANRYSLENLLRLRVHEPGLLVQMAGDDFVDQASVHVMSLVDATQAEVKLYINKTNYLPVRIAYHVLNPNTKEWEDHVDVYGDYRPFQGIQTPKHITRFIDGERVSETFRNTAKYDESYPANTFELSP